MPPKRLPMVSTGRSSRLTAAVASTSTSTGPGIALTKRHRRTASVGAAPCFGVRYTLGQTNSNSSDSMATISATGLTVCACAARVLICAKKSPGMRAISRPKKSFSCDSAISTAMPLVKPITIGTGI